MEVVNSFNKLKGLVPNLQLGMHDKLRISRKERLVYGLPSVI